MSRRSRVRAPPGATFRVTPLLSTCQKPLLHTPTCSAALLLRRHAQRSPSRPVSAFHSLSIFLLHDAFNIHCSSFIIHHSIFVPSLLPHTHTAATLRLASARVCIHKQTQTHTMSLSLSLSSTHARTNTHTYKHTHTNQQTHKPTNTHAMQTDRQTDRHGSLHSVNAICASSEPELGCDKPRAEPLGEKTIRVSELSTD